MATQSFMTEQLQTVNSSVGDQRNSQSSNRQQSAPSQTSQTVQVQTSPSSSSPVQTSGTAQAELSQVPENAPLSLAKVIVPAQVAVVAHPFSQQQTQQQSVLFQALTSQAASHFIALAVPGQENERTDVVPAAHGVSCVQYIDEGGGTNAYSAPNGHMTTYSVYTTPETPSMYTPNSAAYYNTTSSSENYAQVDVSESPGQSAGSLDSHSYSEQQNAFHVMDESSMAEPENSHMACYPSSRLSAATMKWLIDNYEMADGMSVPRSTMYSNYLKHCSDNKMEPLNAASFGKLIRSVFAGLRTRRLGTRGNSKYHYYGIRLKPSSTINKAMEDIVNTTYRQNPFMHMRRLKSEHSVKVENNENVSEKKSYEVNETEKKRSNSQSQQKSPHRIYLGDASTAIPNVEIEMVSLPLPHGITLEKIRQFKVSYRKHCECFLEAVVNFQFGIVENLWHTFWNGINDDESQSEPHFTKPILLLLSTLDPVQEFVKQTDYQFYQNLVDVLIPDVLRPIPSTLTQAIRNFAKSLEGWLRAAMAECSSDILNIKLSAISAFAQTLRRYTSLNHLAQAARAVLQSPIQIKQMTTDLSKVDFRNIQEQASWVCQCNDDTVHRLLSEFRQTLQHHLWLEEWASWLENIVHTTLKPYEGHTLYPKAARQFLLKWSFYSSLVIRDLTLRSAASFGSFHLLRLLYDEYMFFIIEHCIAKATGTTSIAVMGEYLCSGTPEELTGAPELLESTQDEEITISDSTKETLQNGCSDEDIDSSQTCEPSIQTS